MCMKNNSLIYLNKKARLIIGGKTPIPADCGLLCKKACCAVRADISGDELGMLLFPGEEKLFENDPYVKIEKITLNGNPVWFAVCGGVCDRKNRPLACRIFPLLPYIPRSGRRKPSPQFCVIGDPRAEFLCPLLSGNLIDPRFYARVGEMTAALLKNRKMRSFLVSLSETADGYLRFTGPCDDISRTFKNNVFLRGKADDKRAYICQELCP